MAVTSLASFSIAPGIPPGLPERLELEPGKHEVVFLHPFFGREMRESEVEVGDELGGHIVLGHVDGVATLTAREPVGDSERFAFTAPDDLARFIAPKGSIAINDVSLTIHHDDGSTFDINLIPHTLSCTILAAAAPGDGVNLEIDVLARYVARLNQ